MIFATYVFPLLHFFAANPPCQPKGSFFGLPTWYKYLPGQTVTNAITGVSECNVGLTAISQVWLIVAAVLELLLRVGALAALVMIVYAGIQFVQSEGQPDKTAKALSTIIYACVGLGITIAATTVITFVAGRFN